PACRAATERRPPATARPRRLDGPARGTHEYPGRGALGPQSPGWGKRPGDFDPLELFGAARWLTPCADTVAARATGARHPRSPSHDSGGFPRASPWSFFLSTFEAIGWFGSELPPDRSGGNYSGRDSIATLSFCGFVPRVRYWYVPSTTPRTARTSGALGRYDSTARNSPSNSDSVSSPLARRTLPRTSA